MKTITLVFAFLIMLFDSTYAQIGSVDSYQQNTTNNNFTIDWDYELCYDNKCWTCDNEDLDEDHKTITLKSQEIKEGDCNYNDNTLRIFKRYTNHDDTAVLTKFELKDITTIIN